jgi:hypothetical protein
MAEEHSYASFVSVLSNAHMRAYASKPYRDGPYKANVVISPSMLKPIKGQPDSALDRLQAINDRMFMPECDVDVAFTVAKKTMFHPDAICGLKHPTAQCWPIRKDGTADYITKNPSPQELARGMNKVRFFSLDKVPGKAVDYNTPIDELFAILDYSKCHVSYQGGTVWLSIAMGIPTIVVHAFIPEGHQPYKTKVFGQDININVLQDGLIMQVRQHPMEVHTTIGKLDATLSDYT